MITFKNIRWKNLLSTGNQFTEISLNSHSTTLKTGANGNGKSSLLDALTFSLFNKPFRSITKPQLVNSVNEKDCLVEIEFSIGSTEYKIRRGIKPNIFEIYRDGTILDQNASATDQQKWLEQNVLKMSYKSFTQIVILGSSNFVPFMQLPSNHRRDVIEDLLDIKIFSSMNSVLKEKLKVLKDDVKMLELKKDTLKDKVEMQKNFIAELESRGKEYIQNNRVKITNLLKDNESYILNNDKTEEEIHALTKDIEEVSSATERLKKLGTLKGKISQKVSSIQEENHFFSENQVCPTCTQSIDENFRQTKLQSIQKKSQELKSGYDELKKTIQDEELRESHFIQLSRKITQLNHEISQNNTRISSHQRQIRDLENEIQRTEAQLENKNSEHQKLEQFKTDLSDTFDDLTAKKEDMVYHNFSYNLLKDSGVKSQIIKKYLPLINQQVNRYLQMMDFYINFTLDEEFNETIQSPIHENFTYSSFSEGEKARIDLSLIFSWREVAKFKNSVSTNLIIFDEIFDSSLDGFGTDEFLKIIRYVIKDANVFVISHKTGLEDKFDRVITYEKQKGFSFKTES
jgi:DNA repair exonuclease SbcCD ATPase subunit